MADDHLGWFIYFYFLFMSGSNQGVCHMVIVWEGDTSQDICQYQELSPCYPQPVLTTTLPINLPTDHFQPPDFVPISMHHAIPLHNFQRIKVLNLELKLCQ